MKRHPHTAEVTIESPSHIVKGESVDGEKSTIVIVGRYDSVDERADKVKKNALGNEVRVSGTFYTKALKPAGDVTHIKIECLGISASVISWDKYQSHSIISV